MRRLNIPCSSLAETDEIERAQIALGTNDIAFTFIDFTCVDDVPMINNNSGGTVSFNADSTVIVASSAVAGSVGNRFVGYGGGINQKFPGNQNFYYSQRFKIPVLLSGGGLAGVGLASEATYFGAHNGYSATKYLARFAASGNELISTVNVQIANFVAMRISRVGLVTSLSVDDEVAVTGNAFCGAAATGWGPIAFNGAAAIDFSAIIDWMFVAVPRP